MRPGPERVLGGFADLLKDRDSAHLPPTPTPASPLPSRQRAELIRGVWMGGRQPAELVCAEDRV